MRRARDGTLTVAERDRALAALRRDFETIHVVEIVPEVSEAARRESVPVLP